MVCDVGKSALQHFDLLSTPLWIWDFDQAGMLWANQAALRFWGVKDLPGLAAKAATLSESDLANLSACRRFLQLSTPFEGIWPVSDNGHKIDVPCRFSPITIGGGKLAMLAQVNGEEAASANAPVAHAQAVCSPSKIIAEVDQLLRLLEAQIEAMEAISNGQPLEDSLRSIVLIAERLIGPAAVAVMLAQPFGRRLLHAAAPNLPPAVVSALDGTEIGPNEPSFAAAAFRRSRVICRDITLDRGWQRHRQVLVENGIAASWGQPIVNEFGEVVGVFATYYREQKVPSSQDCWVVEALSGLARFALDNERRRAAIHSANERFLSLATTVPGVVYQRVVNPQGQIRYTFISEAVKDLFGVTPEEVLRDASVLFDCFDPSYRADFQKRLFNASQELRLWDVEATIIARDGQRKYTHAIARPSPQPDGSVVWDGVILDATRIKEAELATAAAEARTREAIIESIPQGLILYDEHTAFVTCNSAFLDLYPFLADVAKPGATYADVVRAKTLHRLKAGSEGGEVAADVLDAAVRERLEKHRQGGFREETRLEDGRWILVNEHHTAAGATVTLYTDVSELKKREIALERSNRELQDFASIASHDLQEPLRKIEAFGDRLRDRCSEQLSDDGKVYLERMQHAANRMRRLINDLLTYSRVTTKAQPFEELDLAQIVSEVVVDLQIAIEKSGGQVSCGQIPLLQADPLQMRILMQNLIANALKFRKPDTAPEVRISAKAYDAADAHKKFGVQAAGVVAVKVADNGIGFDMKYADRIFGIFQRLHGRGEYEGTGIGLATCRKIAERHGGRIIVESAPGRGAKFTIVLPVNHNRQ
jgi:signal transduction histidine kinase